MFTPQINNKNSGIERSVFDTSAISFIAEGLQWENKLKCLLGSLLKGNVVFMENSVFVRRPVTQTPRAVPARASGVSSCFCSILLES